MLFKKQCAFYPTKQKNRPAVRGAALIVFGRLLHVVESVSDHLIDQFVSANTDDACFLVDFTQGVGCDSQ